MRVVATAGHVDHGKSTLVKALTGEDPDRWAEEKIRGITIDLGFAATALPSGREIAFVDVPGKDLAMMDINTMRITFRVRNLTNAIYAAFSDPGYPDQVYLGDPRTYELAVSAKW